MALQARLARVMIILILILTPVALPAIHGEGYGYLWTRSVSMIVPAVARTPTGYTGVVSELTVAVAWPGSGIVYVASDPLTELDMQAAARIAAFVASVLAGYDPKSFDFFVRIKADSPIVGGPSASGAMAVGFLAVFRGTNISREFSMTGMIEPDGVLGPVGGIPEKLRAAAQAGARVFIVPAGQIASESLATGMYVNVASLGESLGVRVYEAKTILEAYAYATGDTGLLREYNATRLSCPCSMDWLTQLFVEAIDFFSSVAASNLTCARNRITRLSGNTGVQLSQQVKSVEDLMASAGDAKAKGQYYIAASKYFAAAIEATRLCIIAKALDSRDLGYVYTRASELVREANNTVARVYSILEDRLSGAHRVSDVELQVVIAILDRLDEAERAGVNAVELLRALQAGRVAPTIDHVDTLAGLAAYSYYRAVTASQWLRLLDRAPKGTSIGVEHLDKIAGMYTYFAYSEAAYANTLGVTVAQADEYIGLAKTTLESARSLTDYLKAIMYAVKGYTDYSLELRTVFGIGAAGVDAARQALTILTNIALRHNLNPVIPVLYESLASATADVAAQTSFYSQAASYALLLDMLAKLSTTPPSAGAGQAGVETLTTTVAIVENRTLTVTMPVEVTVTVPYTVNTSTVTKTETRTETIVVGGTASTAAILLTAAIAFAAGLLVSRRS